MREGERKTILKRVALPVLLLLVLPGCGRLAAASATGDASRGAHLYTSYGCLQCHRINGAGPTGPAPAHDLTNDLSEASYSLLHYYLVDNPPTAMVYVKQLGVTPQAMADLIAFEDSSLSPATTSSGGTQGGGAPTATTAPSPSGSTATAKPTSPRSTPTSASTGQSAAQIGAHLWVTDRCSQCHMINGVGGTDAENLTHSPKMSYASWKAYASNPSQPPGMDYVPGLHLTDSQIRAMSAFANSSLTPK